MKWPKVFTRFVTRRLIAVWRKWRGVASTESEVMQAFVLLLFLLNFTETFPISSRLAEGHGIFTRTYVRIMH
jgi:hypothetical protein